MATAHVITVNYDPSAGHSYVDSDGADVTVKRAKKNETITWQIGSGITQMKLYFLNKESPFGSNFVTCVPATPYTLTGRAASYEYVTIVVDADGKLVTPHDPHVVLDGD